MIPVHWLDTRRGQTPSPAVPVLGVTAKGTHVICLWDEKRKRLVAPYAPDTSIHYWIDLPEAPRE